MKESNLFNLINESATLRHNNLSEELIALREAFNLEKSMALLPQNPDFMVGAEPNDLTVAICLTADEGRWSYLTGAEQEDFLALIREGRRKMLAHFSKDEAIKVITEACETGPEF